MIDDAEWIDEASRDVVDRLGSLVAEAGILLACVARDDMPTDDDALLVAPLSPQEVAAALRQATESSSSPAWKRKAVLTSRSRSVWCTRWKRHRKGARWLSRCQT